MCGGAIISDWIPPPRSSRQLTSDLLWDFSDLNNNNEEKKKKKKNGSCKTLRSEVVDFAADFQDFNDCFDDDFKDYSFDVKPLVFHASQLSQPAPGNFYFFLSILFFWLSTK